MFAETTYGTRIAVAVLTTALTGLSYFVYRLVTHRRFYRDLPKPPHSLFWGHLKVFALHFAKFPSKNIIISPVIADIKREYDLGDIFYLDLWPFGPGFMILSAPDAAAIPTTVQVAPQSQGLVALYGWNLGAGFMDCTNGALWKYLHRAIAPTLTASANRAHMPFVISEAAALHARFKAISDRDGVTVDLGYEVGRFPFEVLLRVFLGERPDSSTIDRLYHDSRGFATVVGDIASRSPSPLHAWWLRMTSLRHIKNRIESTIEGLMDREHAEMVQIKDQGLLDKDTSLPTMGRMMLDAVLNERPLDQGLRRLILENGKGLIAAGYGTVKDTLCYIFMLLSTHPEALQKVRQEHDEHFGLSFDGTLASLEDDPDKLQKLDYTTAVVNETLRLFSVGMPIRDPRPDMTTLEYKGKSYPVKNQIFGLDMNGMHYDESLFPEAKKFKPERFLGPASDINRNAYRPFERGPRGCPGQTLAITEMRVAVLMTARWFDFELVDHQPSEVPRVSYTDLDVLIGKHAFQWTDFTPGPAGTVAMKISNTGRE